MTKICNCCGIEKPLEDYHIVKRKNKDPKPNYACKICIRKKGREYSSLGHKRPKIPKINIDKEKQEKCCSKCGETKDLSCFRFRIISHKYPWYNTVCKECEKIEKKNYVKNNRDKVNKLKRKHNKKTRSTTYGKLNLNLSTAISFSLKYDKKGRSWKTLVNFTLDNLKEHLEKQFQPEFNWDNYGSVWHVHHILPKKLFNYESPDDPQFKICWSLNNLAPKNSLENSTEKDFLSDINKKASDLTKEEKLEYLKNKGFNL